MVAHAAHARLAEKAPLSIRTSVAGTTDIACERRHRHWLGSEIDFAEDIKPHPNGDFVEEDSSDRRT